MKSRSRLIGVLIGLVLSVLAIFRTDEHVQPRAFYEELRETDRESVINFEEPTESPDGV